METSIVGIGIIAMGIGLVISALAIEPHLIVQCGYSMLPMFALAGTLIAIVLFAL